MIDKKQLLFLTMGIFQLNKYKGQTIIEVVVALGAGIIVLSAMTMAVVTALNNASQSTNESQATLVAQQGIEIMRNMRNNNYSALAGLQNNTYCLAESCTAVTSSSNSSCGLQTTTCPVNVDNKFIRKVELRQNSTACLASNATPVPGSKQTYINITVSWTDSKCRNSSNQYCHSVALNTCLSNYTGRTAP